VLSMGYSDKELDALVGDEGGSTRAAWRWLRLILQDGDLRRAWPLTDERLRRELVEAWLRKNRSHPALTGHDLVVAAEDLSRETSDHILWAGFAVTQINELANHWRHVDLDHDVTLKPRLIPLDRELILVAHNPGEDLKAGDPIAVCMGLHMRRVGEEWLVADFADEDEMRIPP
jgi:hypothetical protein